MVNSNPETVSTDYDTSDTPLFRAADSGRRARTSADKEKPARRHRPVRRPDAAEPRRAAGARGRAHPRHQPGAIDRAEDRERFQALLEGAVGFSSLRNGTATTLEELREIAHRIGYPIVMRPSYVLGGRAMMIVDDDEEMAEYFALHVGKREA